MDLMLLSLQFIWNIFCGVDIQEYRVYKLQLLKAQNRLDEHELQSAKRNLNDTLRSQMMKNRQSEEIAQIMDALENESEDETESNSKDENDSYQPDYDNSFDFSQSLEEAIEEVTGGVPLRVRYLISFKFSIDEYEGHELPSILCSLNKL